MVACVHNPSTWKVEAGRQEVKASPDYKGEEVWAQEVAEGPEGSLEARMLTYRSTDSGL